jgi:hypothetical protein
MVSFAHGASDFYSGVVWLRAWCSPCRTHRASHSAFGAGSALVALLGIVVARSGPALVWASAAPLAAAAAYGFIALRMGAVSRG